MIDLLFEEEMANAVDTLRDRISEEQIPAFAPSRSRTPLLAAAAAVVILGLGVMWGVFATGDDSSSDILIATQPETNEGQGRDDTVIGDEGEESSAAPDTAGADTGDTDEMVVESAEFGAPSALAQGDQLIGQLTAAEPGQFIVPLPSASAWNADETALLLYRTGDGPVGHSAVSAVTGELIAVVDLDGADIEQIYWHPTDPTMLVAVEGDEVWGFDVTTAERRLLHTLVACPLADADAGHPSPPSRSGVIVVLCTSGTGTQLVQFNLITGVETSEPVDDSVEAVHVSPSGSTVMWMRTDGPAIARTAGAEVSLDLGGELFEFVTVNGVEMIASIQYSGDAVGTVVLFDLSDGSRRVVIGPEAGDEFPPVGPAMHAAGSRLAISSAGPVEGELAGRVLLIDLERVGAEIVATIPHESIRDNHGYWSDAFVSMSPSGRYAVYSSDRGGESVDTTVVEFPP